MPSAALRTWHLVNRRHDSCELDIDSCGAQVGDDRRVGVAAGDHDVDLIDLADPGERLAAQLARVRHDDDRLGVLCHQLVDRGLALVVRAGAAGDADAVDAEERDVEHQSIERRHRERPDELVGLRSHDATRDDELDVWPDRQLVGDVERVRDDRDLGAAVARAVAEVGSEHECPGDLGGGGAAVEPDDAARHDELGSGDADQVLLIGVARHLVAQRQVVRDAVRHRAATGPDEQLLAGQLVEVAAHGRRRHIEAPGGIIDLDAPLGRDDVQQGRPPGWALHRSPKIAHAGQLLATTCKKTL